MYDTDNVAANVAVSSASFFSKGGVIVGILGLIFITISSIMFGHALKENRFKEHDVAKYTVGITIALYVIFEIIGWQQYLKNKNDDPNKAKKMLFYYNLPILIPLGIAAFGCMIVIASKSNAFL